MKFVSARPWWAVVAMVGMGGVHADEVLLKHPLATTTAAELAQAIDYLVPQDRQQAMRSKDRNIRTYLVDYFTVKMMAEAARKKGMDDDDATRMRVENYHNRLLVESLIADYIASAKRPDFEKLARETYKAKPELFMRGEQVDAEHILVAINDQRSEQEALARAQEVYHLLKRDVSAFAALAKEYSDDPSVDRNAGRLGFFDRKKMVPEFSEAAFALQKGGLSEPVKTSYGYHVIHLLERRGQEIVAFDLVKARLMQEEEEKFLAAKRQEIVSSFREDEAIVFDEKAMVEFVDKMIESAEP